MKVLRVLRKGHLVGLALLLGLVGCETLDGGRPLNLLSTEDEIRLGKQLSAEVEKQEKVLDNPAIQAYVRGIGERLALQCARQDVPYQFTVIDNPKTVNAFALPGGHMYIYTGLMKLCANEAELAGVMGHELGHVAGHHHGESLTRQYGISLLASVVLGGHPNVVVEIATELASGGVMARFSRANESEADQLGMDYLFRAGYNPKAMLSFMQKLANQENRLGGARSAPLFASHPPTEERLLRLFNQVQQYPQDLRDQSPVYAERYQQHVLQELK